LEDPAVDGEGLRACKRRDGARPVEPVVLDLDLEASFDVADMPEPWRRGYVEALMGAAKTAEVLDGFVWDSRSGVVLQHKYVAGPSNPKPRALPPWVKVATPLEQNCTRVIGPPELFYEKILATHGLEDRQIVDARLEYAELLRRRGMPDAAEDQLRLALKQAADAVHESPKIIDLRTGIIKKNAPFVTQNILDASTALAIHTASRDPSKSLPIFLSILRVYRADHPGPAPDTSLSTPDPSPVPLDLIKDMQTQVMTDLKYRITSLFTPVEYPPPPPTGNESLRLSPSSTNTDASAAAAALRQHNCAEASAATYAAEVMLATSEA
jgi:hypothetical protein